MAGGLGSSKGSVPGGVAAGCVNGGTATRRVRGRCGRRAGARVQILSGDGKAGSGAVQHSKVPGWIARCADAGARRTLLQAYLPFSFERADEGRPIEPRLSDELASRFADLLAPVRCLALRPAADLRGEGFVQRRSACDPGIRT